MCDGRVLTSWHHTSTTNQQLHNIMTSQLDKSSIKSLLLEPNNPTGDNFQYAEGRVRSLWFNDEVNLIGFIPYDETKMGIDLNSPFVLTPYMIRCEGAKFPSFLCECVRNSNGKRYPLNDCTCVYPNVIEDIPKWIFSNTLDNNAWINGTSLNRNIKKYEQKLSDTLSGKFEKNEDDTYSYIGREYVWELSFRQIKFLAADFLCVCSYINKVTGKHDYVLLPSDYVIRILPSENEQ